MCIPDIGPFSPQQEQVLTFLSSLGTYVSIFQIHIYVLPFLGLFSGLRAAAAAIAGFDLSISFPLSL